MNLNGRVERLEAEAAAGTPCAACGADGSGRQNFVVWYPAREPKPAEVCDVCGRETLIVKVLYGVSADDL